MVPFDGETDMRVRGRPASAGPVWLSVLNDGGLHSQLLPPGGRLTIGRAADCAVVIDDNSLSRYHAALHIIGDEFFVEDLGSRNGTTVGERMLGSGERVQIRLGVAVSLGGSTLILQATQPGNKPRRLLSHAQLELYVDSECTRAAEDGTAFALARVELAGKQRVAERLSELEQALAGSLRPRDLLALYSPGVYEILFVGSDRAGASVLLAEIERQIVARDLHTKSALAAFPSDGRTVEELIDAVSRLLRGGAAEPRGDDAIVRTTLGAPTEVVRRIAASDINVLLFGETGAGKEVMAHALHDLSPRKKKPLVSLNCASFAETLLDSELFGFERGAFTGATQDKPGLLESADGGTVFLDEIGEMPMALQAKLLRVIELKQVQRIGALRPKQIDVRFLAATHRDLDAEVLAGRFRQDLMFRLNGMALVVLPLRERPEEIEPLAELFLQRAAERMHLPRVPLLAKETRALLREYRWPGNVRELRNLVERAVVLCTDGVITPRELPLEKMAMKTLAPVRAPVSSATQTGDLDRRGVAARGLDADAERKRILEALEETQGNQTEAARLLGISRRTLINRVEEYGLPRPRKRS